MCDTRKYDLVKDPNSNLYQIKAIRNFSDVQAGDLGGFVESAQNLSQVGDCWIYDTSCVIGNARMYHDARIFGDSLIKDYAMVSGQATVTNCTLKDHVAIFGNATVKLMAIYDKVQIGGQAYIDPSWQGCTLSGMASFHWTPKNYIVIGPIGSRNAYTTFYKTLNHQIWVDTGCYSGEISEFVKQVTRVHLGYDTHSYKEYMAAIKTAKKFLKI